MHHPLDYQAIATKQEADAHLQQRILQDPQHYVRVLMAPNVHLICYIPAEHRPWKICIPDTSLNHMIQWHHLILNHVGIVRLHETDVIALLSP